MNTKKVLLGVKKEKARQRSEDVAGGCDDRSPSEFTEPFVFRLQRFGKAIWSQNFVVPVNSSAVTVAHRAQFADHAQIVQLPQKSYLLTPVHDAPPFRV